MYGSDGELLFDGKIGIWPFVIQVPAKRNSKNRVAGTLETKCIESITKKVTRDMILNCVLPAIKAKWPPNRSKHIVIQQDNARPHFNNDDPDFKAAATADGWNIELAYQPPNSPDLNVLDLGFFRSIQSLQQKKKALKLDELIHNTVTAYEEQDALKLKYVWLTLQACMLEVLKRKGGIDYAVPHMDKDALAATGDLPEYLNANMDLVKECIRYVQNVGDPGSISELVNSLSNLSENPEDVASTSGTSNEPTGDIEPVGTITEVPTRVNNTTGEFSDFSDDE